MTPLARRGPDGASWALALLAAVAAFAVFYPTLGNEFLNWDDKALLLEIDDWRGFGGRELRWMFSTYHLGHYQPITWLSYGLDYALWGLQPFGFHLTNNLLHAANTVLVYFLALALLRRVFEPHPLSRTQVAAEAVGSWTIRLGALLAALLFALHPMRVESVAWATQRRDLLSSFFLLLTVLAYLRSAAPGQAHRRRWIGITLLVYVLSMISKVGGAPLPVVLLVLDWYPLRRLGPAPREWFSRRGLAVVAEKIPFFAVAIGFAVATLALQKGVWLHTLASHDLAARTAQAFYGLLFYVRKMVVPLDLLPLYELSTPLDPLEPRFILSAVVVVALGVVLLKLWQRFPALPAAGLCYAAMIGPLLGFFQNGPHLVADRYSYLACLSWVILTAGGIVWLVKRYPAAWLRPVVGAMSVVVVVLLSGSTWRQCDVWRDTLSLWRHVLERDPHCFFANNNFAAVLIRRGEDEQALPYGRRSVQVNPKNYLAWSTLWGTLRRLGRKEELRESYLEATRGPLGFARAEGHFGLGELAYEHRDYETALTEYGRALQTIQNQPLVEDELRSFAARAHNNYGVTLQRLERYAEAEPRFRRSIAIYPDTDEARLNLVLLLEQRGEYDEAIGHLEAVLRRNPADDLARQLLERIRAAAPGGS